MKTTVQQNDISRILTSSHHDPFDILGCHPVTVDEKQKTAVRVFHPGAKKISVLAKGITAKKAELSKIHDDGFFEGIFDKKEVFSYKLKLEFENGYVEEIHDPYSFLPVLGELDLHLFNEGNHFELYNKFGSHVIEHNGIKGVHFAVWAPNAQRVSLVGDFNHWDGRCHPMRLLGHSGVWEVFIPELDHGTVYKYEVRNCHGNNVLKSDPFGFYAQYRPETASIVYDLELYDWDDNAWFIEREKTNHLESPMNVYEVHLGSWANSTETTNRYMNYREIAHHLADYVKKMGYTHVELMPIMEHPFDGSWGYQVTGYFAPTSRFGSPDDFRYLVDYFHHNGIGVIVDWVPAHFPKDEHGLALFDGTGLYEHEDPRQGEHSDWGTKIFNFGRHEVTNFLISNLLYWCEKFHIDGFRVDAVASMLYLDYSKNAGEWVPNVHGGNENLEAIEFIKKFNEVVHDRFPGVITVAEESTAWPGVSKPTYLGGLGFDFKWNMGWMNDTLDFFEKDPIYRKYQFNNLTFSLLYAFHENFSLVLSHDEVVHGKCSLVEKMPGNHWEKFANLRLLMGAMYSHPGKKVMFMGGDIAQYKEWSEDVSLDWHLLEHESNNKYQKFVRDLNHLYLNEPALWEKDYDFSGFDWIDFHDSENTVISYLRKGKDQQDYLVFVFNLTPVVRRNYRVGVPEHCFYQEVFNSDSDIYWGTNRGNLGGKHSDAGEWQGRGNSIEIDLPPLSFLVFKPQR